MNKKLFKGLMILALCVVTLCGCTEVENEDMNKTDINETTNKESNEKMDYSDLYSIVLSNGAELKKGMTEEEVARLLGEPTSKVDSRLDKSVFDGKGFVYGDYVEVKYGETALLFYILDDTEEFLLGQVWAHDDSVSFARDTKVGMKKDEITSKFYKSDELKYVNDEEEPWGEYLYGDYTNSDFDTVDIPSPHKYAYENYSGFVVYEMVVAAEGNEFVRSGDESANLIFYYDDNEVVESIMWCFNPAL